MPNTELLQSVSQQVTSSSNTTTLKQEEFSILNSSFEQDRLTRGNKAAGAAAAAAALQPFEHTADDGCLARISKAAHAALLCSAPLASAGFSRVAQLE